jgi:CRISPR type I-E-associated protein CasB/Cse2
MDNFDPMSFVGYMIQLFEHDPGAEQKMRASVSRSPGMDIGCYQIIEPYMGGEPWPSEHVRRCCYAIGTLMTMANNCSRGNLGTHLGDLVNRSRSDQAIEKDLVTLLDRRVIYLDDFYPRLCGIINRLKNEGIQVNFAQLLADLIAWKWSAPTRSWGLSYYRAKLGKFVPEAATTPGREENVQA